MPYESMKFNSLTFLFLLLASSLAASIGELPPQFKLLPQSQKIEMLTGNGINYHNLKSVSLRNIATQPVLCRQRLDNKMFL